MLALGLLILPGAHSQDGTWLDFGNRLGEITFGFGLPLAAAFACWLGGTDARAGTGWLADTAVRRALPRIMDGMAPAVLWPLAGYAVASLTSAARTWSSNLGGFPFDALASNAGALVAVACVGYALGRLAPLRAAAPLIGMAVLLLCAGGLGEPLGLTNGFAQQTYTGSGVPGLDALYGAPIPAWLPWLVTAVFLALAAAAVLLSARRWIPAVLVLMLVIPIKLWLAVSATLDGDQRMAASPVKLACFGSEPRICVGADVAWDDDQLLERVRHVAQRLDGVRGAPTHYVITTTEPVSVTSPQHWQREQPWSAAVVVEKDTDRPDPLLEGELADEIITDAGRGRCDWEIVREAYTWLVPPELRLVTSWWYSPYTPARTSRLDSLPRQERIAWLNAYFSGSRCPELPPLPRYGTQRPEAAQ
ncbi:hypothetical protein ACIGPN_28910 [Streptomyces afghaniensis]|uniref:hypothetical protein n=1 Tax=Streptomyces afghaniensis TaxID=66865 RepID=UPI0037CECAF8